MQLSAQFKLEKETKGTFRYAEETTGQPPKIGTLYVQKWAIPTPPPTASPSLSKHWTDPRCFGIRTRSPRIAFCVRQVPISLKVLQFKPLS